MTPVQKDVRELAVAADGLMPVDVLIGGFPCQSFSPAGNRQGFSDERGECFFEIPRLLHDYASDERPRLVVLENVPAVLTGGDGSWFATIRRSLRRAGYWFRRRSCWRVNVKDTGIPQDRERVFLVAADRERFPYNPFLPPPADWNSRDYDRDPRPIDQIIDRTVEGAAELYLPSGNKYRTMIAAKMAAGNPRRNLFQLRRNYVREWEGGLCPTLTANMGAGGHNVPFIQDAWGIRRLSVAEVAALQGFRSESRLFPNVPASHQYRLLGNAVCVRLAHAVAARCRQILEESCEH